MAAHQFKCRFYRLLVLQDGEATPFTTADWIDLLTKYDQRSYEKRKITFDTGVHLFEPRPVAGQRHLAIHRLKNEGDFLSRVDATGSVSEIMAVSEDGATFADTTCVYFLPYGNIVGIVTANQAAPRANKVAAWLGEQKLLGDHQFTVRPLVVPADHGWEESSDGATKLSASLPVEVLDELAHHLGGATQTFSDDMPGARVDLTITYGNTRPGSAAGRGVLDAVRWLGGRLQGHNTKARASASVYREVVTHQGKRDPKKQRTKLLRQTVELIEYEVASTFELEASVGAVRIDLTLQKIEASAVAHRDTIRRALRSGDTDDDQGTVGGVPTS